MKKRVTIEQIRIAVESYGYMLLSTKYNSYETKLTMVCPKGHVFKMSYDIFKQGSRCSVCKRLNSGSSQRIKYIDLQEVFSKRNFTLLSNTYKNTSTILKYKCNECGTINSTSLASFKLTKFGCTECVKKYKKSRKHSYEYIKNFFENEGYTLLSDVYIDTKSKLKYKCPSGHIHEIIFDSFEQGHRCPTCSIIKKTHAQTLSYDYVKSKIEVSGYKLISTEYISAKTRLDVECPNEHKYKTTYDNFQQNHRCPSCSFKTSKGEKEIAEFVKDGIGSDLVIENDRTVLKGKELDIYIPTKNLAIEYCGLYWHNDQHIDHKYHRWKYDECNKRGIKLITIFEDEWIHKQEICKSRISHILGIQLNKIHANKCELRQVSTDEINVFYELTHLQGRTSSKLHIGLYYNDILVQAMSINELNKTKTIEVKRIANLIGFSIIGGTNKLFRYLRQYAYDNGFNFIRSYCDLRWGNGKVYKHLDFTYKHDTECIPYYVLGDNRFKESLTTQGYPRIWDCGHQTWDYSLLMAQWQKLFSYNLAS